MAVKKNITSQGYLGSTNSGASPSLSALAKKSSTTTSKGSNITARRQYEEGYPVTTTYYNPNLTAQGYPTSYNQGSQPSTSALANKSSSYSTPSYSGSSSYSSSSKKNSSTKSSSPSYSYDMLTGEYYSTPSYSGSYDMLTGEPMESSGSNFDAAGAYRKLLEAYQGRQSEYQDYLNQMNALAQNAYDRGMASLNDNYNQNLQLLSGSYDTQKSTLAENLERAKNQLLESLNRSKKTVSDDAENSLRQAYINNMLAKRDIAQRLSAMGLNGGMTETTLAGLANQYGNNRNSINKALNTNLSNLEGNYNSGLSELEGSYSSSLADALQAYNNALANANAQKYAQIIELENALANNQMNAQSNYQNLLQNYNQNYYDLLRAAIADEVNLL